MPQRGSGDGEVEAETIIAEDGNGRRRASAGVDAKNEEKFLASLGMTGVF